MNTADSTKDFYEQSADEYERATQDRQPQEFLDQFMASLTSGAHILDVGCAYGRDAEIFSKAGFTVTGIDFSEALIAKAKERVPAGDFLVQDFRQLTLQPDAFDGVWANMSLLHLPKKDMAVVLERIHTALKLKGILALRMKQGEGEGLWKDHRYDHEEKFYAYYEKEELKEMLKNTGFVIKNTAMHQSSSSYQDRPILEILSEKLD